MILMIIKPQTFIGDAAFDSGTIYKALLHDLEFEKVYIPLNSHSKIQNEQCPINTNVTVRPLVHLPLVEECSTFILKRIYVPILVFYVVQMNAMKPIECVLLLNKVSIISRQVFV